MNQSPSTSPSRSAFLPLLVSYRPRPALRFLPNSGFLSALSHALLSLSSLYVRSRAWPGVFVRLTLPGLGSASVSPSCPHHVISQFGDTGDHPHGKRQRAREAALWAVDPPEYFTEVRPCNQGTSHLTPGAPHLPNADGQGVFVALKGPSTTPEQQEAVYKRFPEWSPQRHMFMDAPQRQAVRAVCTPP